MRGRSFYVALLLLLFLLFGIKKNSCWLLLFISCDGCDTNTEQAKDLFLLIN
jgi:hypothetical protein